MEHETVRRGSLQTTRGLDPYPDGLTGSRRRDGASFYPRPTASGEQAESLQADGDTHQGYAHEKSPEPPPTHGRLLRVVFKSLRT
jgi:hypothetical protein